MRNVSHPLCLAGSMCLILLVGMSLGAGTPQTGTIEIVAGTGVWGFSGDGGTGTEASFWGVQCLALDSKGNILIADSMNQRVRQVSSSGLITTLAGSGPVGMSAGRFSGDGGPATQAGLSWPHGVAVDGAGNLFISEWMNHRVRRVGPDGKITTVAGTGKQGFSGDGGPATAAALSGPYGLAVDRAGNLFIADFHNGRVRKVSPNGTITTVAGGGTGELGDGGPATAAVLNTPAGVAVDSAGNLFIASQNSHRVRKVSPNGMISTVAGSGPGGIRAGGFSGDGGPATKAQFKFVSSVAVDHAGNLFITDGDNHRVRKVSPDGTITTVAGGGTRGLVDGIAATAATFYPFAVAVDGAGNLLVADSSNRIFKVIGVAAPGLLAGPEKPAAEHEQENAAKQEGAPK
jgi:sugar lactone lactonase YvrE